jgi:hypothetical protein
VIALISGGPTDDYQRVSKALAAAHSRARIDMMIDGGGVGGDRAARRWALENSVNLVTVHQTAGEEGKSHAARTLGIASMYEGELGGVGVIAFGGEDALTAAARDVGLAVWLPK